MGRIWLFILYGVSLFQENLYNIFMIGTSIKRLYVCQLNSTLYYSFLQRKYTGFIFSSNHSLATLLRLKKNTLKSKHLNKVAS